MRTVLYELGVGAPCNKADIVLLLDGSGSIGSVNWQRLLQFVEDLLQVFIIAPGQARVSSLP